MTPETVELVAALLGVAAVLAATGKWAHNRWSARLHHRRITDPYDRDLEDAFKLYERRIDDENVRDSRDDIRRWLREVQDEKQEGSAQLSIYLYIAKYQGKVCAFFCSDYYPSASLLLISYMVAEESSAGSKGVRKIVQALNRELLRRGCTGLVFEMEQPMNGKRDRRLGKWCDFQRIVKEYKINIVRLNIPCVQPRISLWDEGSREQPQFIFYARIFPPLVVEKLSKDTVKGILDILYNEWYAWTILNMMRNIDAMYAKFMTELSRIFLTQSMS
ncbi:MAG: hypothetical protein HY739_02500 [Desulfobacterales bacterium]|nr:hypothetical protein [Desulfobacterales bacterium]